jgi:putative ABC transport system permease protein
VIRQALRSNPWSFLGPFSTQALAAALVTAGLGITTSIGRAPLDAAARRAVTESGLADVAIILVMVAIYLSIIIVGVTMAATIAQQARDIALVRAIGATPGRVRRSVAAQAAIVAVPATLLGVPLGGLAGRAWIHGVVTHDLAPAAVTWQGHPAALPIALAVTVGTSLAGALFAAIRPSRMRPAAALAEAGAPRRRIGVVRTVAGLILVAGGTGLSVALTDLDAETADSLGLFVMLALCVGAGLLGPALLKVAALVGRRFGDLGRLAGDTLGVQAKALSGALVPLTLAIAFTAVKVIMLKTVEHETGVAPPAADRWLEYSGTAVYVAFAAVAAVNTLVTVVLSRRRDLAVTQLAGATRRRALAVVICEALLVTGTAVTVGAAVAAVTTLPMVHAALGTWVPWVPAGWVVGGLLVTTLVVLAGTALPAALAMRRPPIEVVT